MQVDMIHNPSLAIYNLIHSFTSRKVIIGSNFSKNCHFSIVLAKSHVFTLFQECAQDLTRPHSPKWRHARNSKKAGWAFKRILIFAHILGGKLGGGDGR